VFLKVFTFSSPFKLTSPCFPAPFWVEVIHHRKICLGDMQVDCAPPGNIVVRILDNPLITLQLELVVLDIAGSGIVDAVDIKNSLQVCPPPPPSSPRRAFFITRNLPPL